MSDESKLDISIFFDEVDRYFDDPSLSGVEKPKIVIILGGVAVGKTTYRKANFATGYVVVDSVEIFLNLCRGGHFDFPGPFESAIEEIGSFVAEEAISKRYNIVTELIGAEAEEINFLVKELKAAHYEVVVHGLDCDLDESMRRNLNRDEDCISAYFAEDYHYKWLTKAAHEWTISELPFIVQVDDNFHYMDESERYTLGGFSGYGEALAACRDIVDEFLQKSYEPGKTPDQIYEQYVSFGEDPFITPTPFTKNPFSAWKYAELRSKELCGEKVDWREYILDKHPYEWMSLYKSKVGEQLRADETLNSLRKQQASAVIDQHQPFKKQLAEEEELDTSKLEGVDLTEANSWPKWVVRLVYGLYALAVLLLLFAL
jgi:hypothetical protein